MLARRERLTRWKIRGAILPAALIAASCGEPTHPATDEPLPAQRIVADFPGDLEVNQTVMLEVKGIDRFGKPVAAPSLVFSSSDDRVASVSPSGVVRGVGRGTATINISSGALSTSIAVHVKARLRLLPDAVDGWTQGFFLAVGDTVQFDAVYIDVDGKEIDEKPVITWKSGNASAVTLDDTGRAIAVAPALSVLLSAVSADGAVSLDVRVVAAEVGAATVRLAHAANGLGPITFASNKGGQVTLKYGESREFPVSAGMFLVTTLGMPNETLQNTVRKSFGSGLGGGDRLSLYVVGTANVASLVPAWDDGQTVDSLRGRIRLIQGYNFAPVVYLVQQGDIRSGLPTLCYFDPWTVSDYFTRTPGPFDMLLLDKSLNDSGGARMRAQAAPGKSVTMVITGSTPADIGYLAFPDR